MGVLNVRGSCCAALLVLLMSPASRAADTIDFAKVPYLGQGERDRLQSVYPAAPSPKAFAVTPEGRWSGTWNTNNNLTPGDAERMTLERCEFTYGPQCILYAIDMRATGETVPRPPIILKEGRFDPARVPFVNSKVRANDAVGYLKAPGNKAFALHRNGAYAFATGRDFKSDARRDALRGCARNEPVGCFIYAVDDMIVYEAPQQRPQ